MNDSPRLPVSLERVPLFQATFEIRFNPTQSAVADLLPGIIFSELREEYGKSQATPLAGVPLEIRNQTPNFRHQPQYRLVGESAVVYVGDEVVGLNQGPPYEGWKALRPRIETFLSVLVETELIGQLQRYSLKFDNLLEGEEGRRLGLINFDVDLAGMELQEPGMQFRTEIVDEELTRIIQLSPDSTVNTRHGDTLRGLLLNLDCIRLRPEDGFLEDPREGLEAIHTELKRLFFSIISDETLQSLNPEYE